MMKIGGLTFEYGLFLAPLAGITDRAFREICVSYGAEGVCSEMISAKGLHYNDRKTALLASFTEKEAPFGIQIFGSEPEIMAESAARLADNDYPDCANSAKPDWIDINMGCPMPKITKNGEGSALMKNVALAGEIVREVKRAVSVPVTVKMRAGWDGKSKNAVRLAEEVVKNGADAVFVHGRTREQLYRDPVDLNIIADVKRAVDVPVIANGGIFSSDDAVRVLDKTSADGIMLARGVLGDPFLFAEIKARLKGEKYEKPTFEERLGVALLQAKNAVSYKGERTAICEMRKHLSYYVRGEKGTAEARRRINAATTLSEIERIISDLKAESAEVSL